MKKAYLAGKVTGLNSAEELFTRAERILEEMGYAVINPIRLIGAIDRKAPSAFSYEDCMTICFAAVSISEAVFLLPNWMDSPGAIREYNTARGLGKPVVFLDDEFRPVNN